MVFRNISYLLSFIIFSFFSCENRIDNSTPEKFAESVFYTLKNNDFIKAKKLLILPSDSLFAESSEFRSEINKSIGIDSLHIKYIEYTEERFNEAYTEGKKLGITWNNANFVNFDFEEKYRESKKLNYIVGKVYFKSNNKDYYIKLRKIFRLQNGLKNFKIYKPIDIQKEIEEEKRRKEELLKKPYRPILLFFSNGNWEWRYSSPKTFSNFFITLANKTEYDFNYIKYRLTLYSVKKKIKREVFSKTYEKYDKIYSGDIIRFEVFELRDFYLGANVSNDNNFEWTATILDAKPRHNY